MHQNTTRGGASGRGLSGTASEAFQVLTRELVRMVFRHVAYFENAYNVLVAEQAQQAPAPEPEAQPQEAENEADWSETSESDSSSDDSDEEWDSDDPGEYLGQEPARDDDE